MLPLLEIRANRKVKYGAAHVADDWAGWYEGIP